MASCLLHNLDDFDKTDMQSASVLLGLMPTALSYVGPTVNDLALVFSRRPVLASLVGLGAPVTSVNRLLVLNGFEESLRITGYSPYHEKINTRRLS